jgi:zinc/manganese transport system ATP-binding protein
VTEVTISDLSMSYPGQRKPALCSLSTLIPRGRITAVVGPNGSGKSTLLAAIAGVVRPSAGSVERRCACPALVVQRSNAADALPITVRETVAMGRWARRGPWRRLTRQDREVVESCMARLNILDLAERRLGTLSGGQRQRALVAQGLAQEAELLLLDEPDAGLDIAARRHITQALAQARTRDGVTVVQATHDLDEALRADHCLLLREGRLVAAGPPEEVLTPDALTRAWGLPLQPLRPVHTVLPVVPSDGGRSRGRGEALGA